MFGVCNSLGIKSIMFKVLFRYWFTSSDDFRSLAMRGHAAKQGREEDKGQLSTLTINVFCYASMHAEQTLPSLVTPQMS
jgi:hypothetical protein